MSRICQVTGKRPMHGNRRSRAMNASKRWFSPNMHYHRFWIGSQKRFCLLKVSAKGMRIIDKLGIDYVLSNSFSKNKKLMK